MIDIHLLSRKINIILDKYFTLDITYHIDEDEIRYTVKISIMLGVDHTNVDNLLVSEGFTNVSYNEVRTRVLKYYHSTKVNRVHD